MQILSKRLLQKYTKIGNQDKANKFDKNPIYSEMFHPFKNGNPPDIQNCLLASMVCFQRV